MPSQQLLTSLGEALGSGALVQELLATSGGSGDTVFNVMDPAYGALGDGSANDTAAIQAAVNAAVAAGDGAVVEIPYGTFVVGASTLADAAAIEVGTLSATANVRITGNGTLKLAAGSAADAVLQLNGDYIQVDGIQIDGNAAGVPTGRGEGLRVNGSYCTARGVLSRDTTQASLAGFTFMVNSSAVGTLMEGCTSVNSGESSISQRGDWTIIRDFRSIGCYGNGMACAGGDNECLVVDGYYFESTVSDKTGMLIDVSVDDDGVTGYRYNHVFLSNILINHGSSAILGNGMKISRVRNVHMDNVRVLHTSRAFHSMRFAEAVGNVSMRNCVFSQDVYQEAGAYDITGSISAVATSAGFAQFTSASHGLRTGDWIIITGTTSYNGVHEVTASAADVFTTNWKYVADETGTFAAGMDNFEAVNCKLGTIGETAGQCSFESIRAAKISIRNCTMQNFSSGAVMLMDPASFPQAGYQSIRILDCDCVGNSASSVFVLRTDTTALTQPGVLTIGGCKRRNLGAGTTYTTQNATLPYVMPVRASGVRTITANITLTRDDHGKTFLAGAADLVVTLPAANDAEDGGAGIELTFCLAAAGLSGGTGLSLSPNSNDKIMGNGFTVADNKDAILTGATDREGDSITLLSDGVDGWYITAITGTWARQA